MTSDLEVPDRGAAEGPGLGPAGVIYGLAMAAAESRDPGHLATLAVDRAMKLLDAGGAVVYAFDSATGLLSPLAETESMVGEVNLKPGVGAIGLAYERGQPVVVDDYRTWPAALAGSRERGMVSAVAVPLNGHAGAIGALGVWTYEQRAFGANDLRLLEAFATQLAPILETAQLRAEAEARAARFQALHEVAVASASVKDPMYLARLAVERVVPMLGAAGAGLWWADEEAGEILRPLAWIDSRQGPRAGELLPGEGAVGMAYKRKRSINVDDYPNWRGAISQPRERGVESVIAMPLMVAGGPVGSIVAWSYTTGAFSSADEEVLNLLAAQVAPVIYGARLAADAERQSRVFRALNELAVAASGILAPAELSALVVDRAVELVGARSGALVWAEADGELIRLYDSDASIVMPERIALGHGLVGRVVVDRRPRQIADYQNWDGAFTAAMGSEIRSVSAVPLLVGDRALGGLVLRSEMLGYFEDEKIELMSLLAAQVGPAMAAARLHDDLRAQESRYRALFHTIASGVVVQGPGGVIVAANPAAAEIVGTAVDDMIGRRSDELWEVVDGGPRPAVSALESGEATHNDSFRIRRPDGSERWLMVDSVPRTDQQGAVVEVVSAFADVTERRDAEERFRAVVTQAPIAIVRFDVGGRIEDANPKMCEMLGHAREELVGQSLRDYVHQEDLTWAAVGRVARGIAEPLSGVVRLIRRDGNTVWVNATLARVKGLGSNPDFLIGMAEDITERKKQEDALAHQALHDALTDLPNRTLLLDRLRQGIRVAQREQKRLALLMMDLDRFKDVNDTFGHHAGDHLLRDVAKRLREALRSSDTVARLGGDEFAIVLSDIDLDGAQIIAWKLLDALRPTFEVEGEEVWVGASVGVALYPDHGGDSDLLMRHADIAMYVAKRGGSGCAVYVPPAEDQASRTSQRKART